MGVLVVIVIVIIIVVFISKNKKQNEHIAKQGGMKKKYSELIDYIASQDNRVKIINETGNSVLLGLNTVGGNTTFHLVQTYGDITIQWKMKSPMYGNHNLEWSFDEFMDQSKMIDKIENDLGKYQNNIMQNYR